MLFKRRKTPTKMINLSAHLSSLHDSLSPEPQRSCNIGAALILGIALASAGILIAKLYFS